MDLSKMKDPEKLYLCRWYFKAGFALLPFVWLVNGIWFFKDAFRRSTFDEQKRMQFYVTFSLIGALVWITSIIIWIYIYQTKRTEWGAIGDYMSFVLPTGKM